MRTNPILAVLLFVVTNVSAQYFQKTYNFNNTSNDLAGKGVNAVLTGGNNLYVQAGTTIFTPLGSTVSTTAPMVTSTDFTSAQNFCAVYPFPLLNGNTVLARGRAIARDPNTGELIVLGDFTSTPTNTTGVFFFRVTAAGAVVAGSLNYFFHPNNRAINAAAIKIVPGATVQIVACGRAESSVTAGSFNPWVARYNLNFTAGWFKIYDEIAANVTWNARANDLVETIVGPLGASEIGVVGEQVNANNYRGFLMRLNPVNGSLINYTTYDLATNSDDRLTSITRCNNTSPGVGYIMAGYTNINGTTTATPKVWAIRTNNTGLVVNWSNRYTYPVTTASCFANGIVERFNTINTFEYYISGTTTSGLIGSADVILYKLDPNGNLPGNNVVTIGVVGNTNEFGINIDKSDVGTTVPGLTIFGQREGVLGSGNNDFYKIKCYFNGKITIAPPCKDTVKLADRIAQQTSTVAFSTPTVDVFPKVQPNPTLIDCNQFIICNTATIAGGSNARMIAGTTNLELATINGELAVTAYPNPLRNNQDLQLAINSPEDQLTTLTIINMLGQVVYSSSKEMKAGVNTIQLTLPELKEGIYTVNITSGKLTKNVLISLTN
jgi:hypothetical protein